MARETLDAKARRLLAEGRLCVLLADAERIEAKVRGSKTEHSTGYQRGGWWCDCEAHRFGRRCSHLAALQPVTVRPSREQAVAGAWAASAGGGQADRLAPRGFLPLPTGLCSCAPPDCAMIAIHPDRV
jgi:hypothetical protein